MSSSQLEHLLRQVLLLERRQGFRDRAMVGGLAQFGRHLHGQAPGPSRVPEIALLLANYDVEDQAERRRVVDEAMRLLTEPRDAVSAVYSAPRSEEQSAGRDPNSFLRQLSAEELPSGDKSPKTTRARRTATSKPRKPPTLDSPVDDLRGVGTRLVESLSAVGVVTVRDLLYYFPREHVDYRRRDGIRSLGYGDRATIVGTVQTIRTRHVRAKLSITTAVVADDSGRIPVRWFNQPYLEKQLRIGRQIAISGEADVFDGRLTFVPRDYEWVDERELTHAGRLVPLYRLTRGLHQKGLRTLIKQAVETYGAQVVDYLPDEVRARSELRDEAQALDHFHFPEDEDDLDSARRRLAFDEIFSIQLGLLRRKHQWQGTGIAPTLDVTQAEWERFLSALPFGLTGAQQRVIQDLRASIASSKPMSRLVQGDVGSGKTVVAAFALYAAALRGYHGAMMAPTEILAQQHFTSLKGWIEPLGLRVGKLTGSTKASERRKLRDGISRGEVDIVVGTHTLFQEEVDFPRLAVAVVDEQHRFGVEQRTRLRQKGIHPHLLAMTATPIPRTLALTVYGDLDISVLNELPPGRGPVQTELSPAAGSAYARVRDEVTKGRQAFVVCPVIDETSEGDTKSALTEHRRLKSDVFSDLEVGLLHGRMPAREKDNVLSEFRRGRYDVLVATSVVEVGIDIPNATVMVIQEAHRFGLAQLHQLRGRIGRGGENSYCILVSEAREGVTRDRLMAVSRSQDGFELAEEDLRLRGPGEFWGTRQSGIPQLRVAGPGDVEILQDARRVADEIVTRDPELKRPEHTLLRDRVERFWAQEADLN